MLPFPSVSLSPSSVPVPALLSPISFYSLSLSCDFGAYVPSQMSSPLELVLASHIELDIESVDFVVPASKNPPSRSRTFEIGPIPFRRLFLCTFLSTRQRHPFLFHSAYWSRFCRSRARVRYHRSLRDRLLLTIEHTYDPANRLLGASRSSIDGQNDHIAIYSSSFYRALRILIYGR